MDDNITQVIFDYNKIFTALNSKLKKGYDLQQAIQAVESNEESQPHEFPDRHLINYIKYRLQKEYPQYVYLYNDISSEHGLCLIL